MQPILLTVAFLSAAWAMPTSDATGGADDIEARQGTGIGILISAIIPLFKGAIFGTPPACADSFDDGDTFWVATGQDSAGNWWQTCFMNDTDSAVWTQEDADVTNCLTNLHYTQADTCISVAGSSCDNGYISGGGRVQQLKELIIGSGTQSYAQLSAAESGTLQAGITSLIGQNVRGTGYKGPFMTDESGTTLESSRGQMMVYWIGEDAC